MKKQSTRAPWTREQDSGAFSFLQGDKVALTTALFLFLEEKMKKPNSLEAHIKELKDLLARQRKRITSPVSLQLPACPANQQAVNRCK